MSVVKNKYENYTRMLHYTGTVVFDGDLLIN